MVNSIFSLFTSDKEGLAASADDLLTVLPYIIVKSGIKQLLQQHRFISIFIYGDRADKSGFALTNLQACSE